MTKLTTKFSSLDEALAFDAEVTQGDWVTGRTDRRKTGKSYGREVYLAIDVPARAEAHFKEAIRRHGGQLVGDFPTS